MLVNAESLCEKMSRTLLRVYSRFPLASNVYMRCILGESWWIRYSCRGWLVVSRFKIGVSLAGAQTIRYWGQKFFLGIALRNLRLLHAAIPCCPLREWMLY